MHLRAEFGRLGIDTPFEPDAGLCTMRTAGRARPSSGRSLIDCCAAAGLPERAWHTALDDARGAGELLNDNVFGGTYGVVVPAAVVVVTAADGMAVLGRVTAVVARGGS